MRKISFFILLGIMTVLNADLIKRPIYAHGMKKQNECLKGGYGVCFQEDGKWKHRVCSNKVYPWSKSHKHSETDGKKKC